MLNANRKQDVDIVTKHISEILERRQNAGEVYVLFFFFFFHINLLTMNKHINHVLFFFSWQKYRIKYL